MVLVRIRGRRWRARSYASGIVGIVVGVLLALLVGRVAGEPSNVDEPRSLDLGGSARRALPSLPRTVANLPAQPAAVVYGAVGGAAGYAKSGALVVSGRDNYANQVFRDISAAGGHVLLYLNAVIDDAHGRYHEMLMSHSRCGPAVPSWPGAPRANGQTVLNDFRAGGVLQNKLECVLERMVAENPHIAGFFADDVGSRSWFPGFDWGSFGARNRRAYRVGAIALTKTFRHVADHHGLIILVNGTWAGGSLRSRGGGYPVSSQSGNALADGGTVEHHDGQIDYFAAYACSSQWASRSPVTRGRAFNFAITSSAIGTAEYLHSNCFSWIAQQLDYSRAPPPWWPFHATGLPTSVDR